MQLYYAYLYTVWIASATAAGIYVYNDAPLRARSRLWAIASGILFPVLTLCYIYLNRRERRLASSIPEYSVIRSTPVTAGKENYAKAMNRLEAPMSEMQDRGIRLPRCQHCGTAVSSFDSVCPLCGTCLNANT